VDISEMMGSEMHLHIKTDAGALVIRAAIDESLEAYSFSHNAKQDFYFSFPASRIHLFDQGTELSL